MLKEDRKILSQCILPVCFLIVVADIGLYYTIRKEAALERMQSPNSAVNTSRRFPDSVTAKGSLNKDGDSLVGDGISENHTKRFNAFEKFGYANISLMKPRSEMRPLYNFTMTPWKIKPNESSQISKGILDKYVNWSMVVVVKSHAEHAAKRMMARDTWGSFKYLNGVRLETVFVVGKGKNAEAEMELLRENGKYGDLLQVDMDEVYADVGRKVLAGMQWVSQNFPPHWIYSSADDDMIPDLIELYKDVEELIELGYRSRHVSQTQKSSAEASSSIFQPDIISKLPIRCGLHFAAKSLPKRGKCKWCITHAVYPLSIYPPFCLGGWYSMPVALASGIYGISRRHEYYRLDDVWITGLLRLSYFSWRDSNEYFGVGRYNQTIGIWNVVHSVAMHGYSDKQMRDLEWEIPRHAREFIRTF